MWNSFLGALEKRVGAPKKIVADKYIIMRAAKKVIGEAFGKVGRDNILVLDVFIGQLKVRCGTSTWKSELLLNHSRIVNLINQEIGQNEIRKIVIEQ